MRISDWSSDVCSSDLRVNLWGFGWSAGEGIPPANATPALSFHQFEHDQTMRGKRGRKRAAFDPRIIERRRLDDIGRPEIVVRRHAACGGQHPSAHATGAAARKRYRQRSEEHTSELQSLMRI